MSASGHDLARARRSSAKVTSHLQPAASVQRPTYAIGDCPRYGRHCGMSAFHPLRTEAHAFIFGADEDEVRWEERLKRWEG
jgi:hypothetical protein